MQQSLINKKLNTAAPENVEVPPLVNEPIDFTQFDRPPDLSWITSLWQKKLTADDNHFKRIATHAVVVLVLLLAMSLSSQNISWGAQGYRHTLAEVIGPTVELVPEEEPSVALTLPQKLTNLVEGVFNRAAVPQTISQTEADIEAAPQSVEAEAAIPVSRANEIFRYYVEPGDTISGIAVQFGLSPETIMWSNEALANNPDLLSVGQELIILPEDGVYHQVGPGDTIAGIASTFKADPIDIINHPLNGLTSADALIQPGQWLIVPRGTRPFIPRTVTAYTGPVPDDATGGTGTFGWPTSGSIFQGYWSAHPGIDVAAWLGAPVAAADSGHVVAAGWDDTGYGYAVVIDHGNGFQTLYAHMQAYYVDSGDNVVKGQTIGEMGSTGNSTGPHLHFEVRQGTVQRNPIGFLP